MSSNDKIKSLFSWCLNQTKNYKHLNITNFTSSWRNGLGFCAILHRYGPEYIDYESLSSDNIYENCQLAFYTAEKHFGIPALLDAKEMVTLKSPDRLSIITYLLQYYSTLAPKRPKVPSIVGYPLSPIENISDDRNAEDKVNSASDMDSSPEQRDQFICEICSEIIYFLEKLLVSDKYYHRACYREAQLTNLKARNRTLERPSAQFDNQLNKNNIEFENNNRKSRLHSLSPDARERLSLKNEKAKSKAEIENETPISSDNDKEIVDESQRKRSLSKSLSRSASIQALSVKEINRSNTELDGNNLRPRLRSLSPPNNTMRPPSLDCHLEKRSLENSPSKSLRQFSIDRSSPSASSTHYVSINASSTDSLPKSLLGTVEKSNCDMSKKFLTKLYPGSLNTSRSSLNSSFGKKRRAPPPPPPPPPPPSVATNRNMPHPSKPIAKQKTGFKPKPIYPKDLNPFAEFEDVNPSDNDTNPFAEYMTDEPVKPSVKPRKRLAPKLPPKSVLVMDAPVLDMSCPVSDEDQNRLERVTSVSEQDISPSLPSLPESLNLSNQKTTSSKDTYETSLETTSSSITPELKHENTQTSDSIRKPEPLKRTKQLIEKSQSIDSINLLISCHNSKNKPPAPPRPAPLKREVRGDTSYEFIPYESLYSELEEINKKQSELENKGRSLQDALKEVNEKDERYDTFLHEWLDIVEKKNVMYSKEHHLHEILRRQELEDRHSDLEYELRVLMGKQESLKTAAEKAREEELLNQILDTVNARAKLVEEDVELSEKSATNDISKKKSSLKKIFSCKHRSNSLGKTVFRFKKQKKSQKNHKIESSLAS